MSLDAVSSSFLGSLLTNKTSCCTYGLEPSMNNESRERRRENYIHNAPDLGQL